MSNITVQEGTAAGSCDYITVWIGDQLFGLPVFSVQDVFMPDSITEVPLATNDIAGVLNLRGRIVTAIDMRKRLGLPCRADGGKSMAVGIEAGGESYGLVIDSVGDVLVLDNSTLESNPANLDPRWTAVSGGVHRLDGRLMVVLNVERVLALNVSDAAAA